MINKIIGLWKAQKEKREDSIFLGRLKKHPIIQIIESVCMEYMHDENMPLNKYLSNEGKQDLIKNIIEELSEIIASDNPLLLVREYLAAQIIEMSKYNVVTIKHVSETYIDEWDFVCKYGTTGDLFAHIKDIARKDEEINDLVFTRANLDQNATENDIGITCFHYYNLKLFRALVGNRIRLYIKDFHDDPQKDWFKPYVGVQHIIAEEDIRDAIGLNSAIEDSRHFDVLKYRTFTDAVVSGVQHPNLEWEKHFKQKLPDFSYEEES